MSWRRDVGEGLLWVGLCLLLGWLSYPYLPEKIPCHWNAQWQPDGWMSREMAVWFMPLLLAGLWSVLTLCFWLAATERGQLRLKEEDLPLLLGVRTLIGAFLLATHAGMIGVGLGWLATPRPLLLPALGIFFIVIGSVLPKLQRNWVAGVRLPWTLVNEAAWRATNRTVGYGFIAVGILFVVAPLFPLRFDLVPLVLIFMLLPAALVQAYIVYRRSNAQTS